MSDTTTTHSSRNRELLWGLVLAVGTGFVVWAIFATVRYHWNWSAFWAYRNLVLKGWGVTLIISAGAMVLAVVLATLLLLGQRSPWAPARMLSRSYVEIVRGTPLLVQLMIGYYFVANALRINEPIPVGIVLLGSFEGAYLAEILRGAVESIGASQIEAARAVGFDRVQIYRYVIAPQAMRRALPGAAGQMVSLIKDSSLLSVLGIEELTQAVQIANSSTAAPMEGYIPLAFMYLALTLPLSHLAKRLEERYRYET